MQLLDNGKNLCESSIVEEKNELYKYFPEFDNKLCRKNVDEIWLTFKNSLTSFLIKSYWLPKAPNQGNFKTLSFCQNYNYVGYRWKKVK